MAAMKKTGRGGQGDRSEAGEVDLTAKLEELGIKLGVPIEGTIVPLRDTAVPSYRDDHFSGELSIDLSSSSTPV